MKKFLKIPIEKIAYNELFHNTCPGYFVNGENINKTVECSSTSKTCEECVQSFIDKYTVEEQD
jgi:hypothetical protein